RLQVGCEVVSKGCAERWVLGRVLRFALDTVAAPSDRLRLDVHQRILDRKSQTVLLEHFRLEQAQRGVVIQNVNTAPEGADYQIVLAFLNVDVAHGDGWQSALELNPFLTAVYGKENAKLR